MLPPPMSLLCQALRAPALLFDSLLFVFCILAEISILDGGTSSHGSVSVACPLCIPTHVLSKITTFERWDGVWNVRFMAILRALVFRIYSLLVGIFTSPIGDPFTILCTKVPVRFFFPLIAVSAAQLVVIPVLEMVLIDFRSIVNIVPSNL
jgi:hypothetical protein